VAEVYVEVREAERSGDVDV
jgi:hypothetical protein